MSTEILNAIDAEVDSLGAELAQLSEQLDAGRKRVEALSMTRELVEGLGNGRLEELHGELEGIIGLALPIKREAVKPPPEKKPTPKRKPKGGRKKVAATATRAWADKHAAIDGQVLEGLRGLGERAAFSAVRRAVPGEISTHALKSSLRRLTDAGQIETTGQRAGTRYSVPGAAPRKARAATEAPPKVDRAARSEDEDAANRKVLAFVRKLGRASEKQVAEMLGVSESDAARRLQSLAHTSPLKKALGMWSIEATVADDDGAKTGPERRVMAAVREAGGSVDEGTLAFASQLPTNELRSILSGLVRRGALHRRNADGVTLVELPGDGDLAA